MRQQPYYEGTEQTLTWKLTDEKKCHKLSHHPMIPCPERICPRAFMTVACYRSVNSRSGSLAIATAFWWQCQLQGLRCWKNLTNLSASNRNFVLYDSLNCDEWQRYGIRSTRPTHHVCQPSVALDFAAKPGNGLWSCLWVRYVWWLYTGNE
jgi:hypothetical protein